MKCPYRNFEDCIVEKCPSCNYKENKRIRIAGRKPHYMSDETAMKEGCIWEEVETTYEFVSCKLIENAVQPIQPKKEIINNNTRTSVVVKKSIF